jgi:hypothetical protein
VRHKTITIKKVEIIKKSGENKQRIRLMLVALGLNVALLAVALYITKLFNSYKESSKVVMVHESGTYQDLIMSNDVANQVEMESHIRVFYATMFSFDAASYRENVEVAQNLCDIETANRIETQFKQLNLQNKLIRAGASIFTQPVENNGISIDWDGGDPYQVKVVLEQVIRDGTGETSQLMEHEFLIKSRGINRERYNVHGLQIRDWKHIRYIE